MNDSGIVEQSYARGEDLPPLLDQTVFDNFAVTAGRFGDNLAIADAAAGRTWSYREMLRDVRALAAGLRRAGVRRGDRIGVWSPNCAEWVLAQYATAAIGAILVNINPSYRQNEVDFALRHVGISLVLVSPPFKDSDYPCLLYTSDAADERSSVDLGGRRIIKKKNEERKRVSHTMNHNTHKRGHYKNRGRYKQRR